eukprot:TRINITY_DN18518_c0_g1_i1.p1 TRINITY_DN18518_c0_g1~~TRINITY_DN18518_c0_g1_i1.p1  ORF type:complete len:610 (-),score=85.49 TRINITY_DN18518_c0_g1_i1:424-2202(-)
MPPERGLEPWVCAWAEGICRVLEDVLPPNGGAVSALGPQARPGSASYLTGAAPLSARAGSKQVDPQESLQTVASSETLRLTMHGLLSEKGARRRGKQRRPAGGPPSRAGAPPAEPVAGPPAPLDSLSAVVALSRVEKALEPFLQARAAEPARSVAAAHSSQATPRYLQSSGPGHASGQVQAPAGAVGSSSALDGQRGPSSLASPRTYSQQAPAHVAPKSPRRAGTGGSAGGGHPQSGPSGGHPVPATFPGASAGGAAASATSVRPRPPVPPLSLGDLRAATAVSSASQVVPAQHPYNAVGQDSRYSMIRAKQPSQEPWSAAGSSTAASSGNPAEASRRSARGIGHIIQELAMRTVSPQRPGSAAAGAHASNDAPPLVSPRGCLGLSPRNSLANNHAAVGNVLSPRVASGVTPRGAGASAAGGGGTSPRRGLVRDMSTTASGATLGSSSLALPGRGAGARPARDAATCSAASTYEGAAGYPASGSGHSAFPGAGPSGCQGAHAFAPGGVPAGNLLLAQQAVQSRIGRINGLVDRLRRCAERQEALAKTSTQELVRLGVLEDVLEPIDEPESARRSEGSDTSSCEMGAPPPSAR